MSGQEFDFLDGVQYYQSGGMYNFAIHDLPFDKFGLYVYKVSSNEVKGRFREVGDLIMDSFSRRKGGFSEREGEVARDFFMADYSHSCGCALKSLEEFEKKYDKRSGPGICLQDYGKKRDLEAEEFAHFSLLLFKRAYESLKNAKHFTRFFSFEELDEAEFLECFDDLSYGRRRARMAHEIPNNYLKIANCIRGKEAAILAERYEEAAVFRDEIMRIAGLNHSRGN